MKSLSLILIATLGLIHSTAAFAESPAEAVSSSERAQTEFSFAPSLGYTTYDSFLLGLNAGLATSISTRWQILGEMGSTASFKNGFSKYDLRAGVQYNFSDSLRNLFYAGAGLGFTRRMSNFEKTNNELVFVRAGYRMEISEDFNWSPHVSVTAEPSRYGVGLELLNFSLFF